MSKENKISVTVDWDLEYNQDSLNERIEQAVINQATEIYLKRLDNKFADKLETLLHDQAYKIVKNISSFQLDQCNANGLKEVISMEDFLVKKSIESLSIKRDSYGRTDSSASSDKRTIIEWVVADIIKKDSEGFSLALKTEIQRIENEYHAKLQEMVTKTLAPVYKQLVDKLQK